MLALVLAVLVPQAPVPDYTKEPSGVVTVPPARWATGLPSTPGPLNVGSNLQMNSDATTAMQNETTIAINPLDPRNFVGGANDYRGGAVRAGWYTSRDGGLTRAADATFPTQAGWTDAGDPAVTSDGAGRFLFLDLQFTRSPQVGALWLHVSNDGGLTWPIDRLIHQSTGNLPDKPYIVADRRTSGTFAGSLYVTFTGFGSAPIGLNCKFSRDQGQTWSAPVAIGSGQGTSPAVGPNGEVYVAWQNGGQIQVNRSTNGGVSFLGVVTVAAITANPGTLPPTSFRCNSFPSLDVDNSTSAFRGRLHCAWSARSGSSSEIFSAFSDTSGATWSAPVRINDVVTGDQFFQGLTVDENGVVWCMWLDRRNDPANTRYDCYTSASYDGGATWLPNWRVTSAMSNPGTSGFIGDYSGIAAGGGRGYPLWVDIRTGADQNVYVAPVQADLEFAPTALSASAGGTVQLPLRAGPAHAGEIYLLLAGCTGTTPGVPLGPGIHLNLNPDICTQLSILGANVPPHANSIGVLDARGIAPVQPSYIAPPGLLAFLAGGQLSFAYLGISPALQFTYGSNAVSVAINP